MQPCSHREHRPSCLLQQRLQAELGPYVRVSPAATTLIQRMSRVFFLVEGMDLSRWVDALWASTHWLAQSERFAWALWLRSCLSSMAILRKKELYAGLHGRTMKAAPGVPK